MDPKNEYRTSGAESGIQIYDLTKTLCTVASEHLGTTETKDP